VLKDGGSRSSKGGYNDMGRAEGEEEEDNESEYDGDSEDHLEDDIADESDAGSLIESMFNDSDPDP